MEDWDNRVWRSGGLDDWEVEDWEIGGLGDRRLGHFGIREIRNSGKEDAGKNWKNGPCHARKTTAGTFFYTDFFFSIQKD